MLRHAAPTTRSATTPAAATDGFNPAVNKIRIKGVTANADEIVDLCLKNGKVARP